MSHVNGPLQTANRFDADATYLEALAACGDQHPSDVDLVERWLAIQARLRRLRGDIDALAVGRKHDRNFQKRCRDAYDARAELGRLEFRELLKDWPPALFGIEFPH